MPCDGKPFQPLPHSSQKRIRPPVGKIKAGLNLANYVSPPTLSAMQWLQSLDTALFRWINTSWANPVFDVLMPWLSGNRLFVPLLLLLGAVYLWRQRGRALLVLLMVGCAVGLADGLICNPVKKAVGRPRPFEVLTDVRLPGRDDANSRMLTRPAPATDNPPSPATAKRRLNSMPSAHAANWFAATLVLFLCHRRSVRFMLPLAVLVALSRVYNGVHYPSDVLAGAALGAGGAVAFVVALNGLWRWAGRRWFPLWWKLWPVLPPDAAGNLVASRTTPGQAIPPDAVGLDRHWMRAGFVLIVVMLIGRWLYLASGTIELSEDEAYQWLWSKHPALSYYSKPPMIAYTQLLGTTIWGDNEFGVRFFSPLIAAILSWMTLRFFAREVSGRAGFAVLLIMTAMPLLSVGATLMTVDPLSVLFWTAGMFAGWRAFTKEYRTANWLWVGLWLGLGFLSKYTALFQIFCWALFFIAWPPARHHLRRAGPYLAVLVLLVCSLPVVIWNAQRGWPTVEHVAMDNAGLGQPWEPTLQYFFEFILAELALLNPVFFVGILIALVRAWRRRNDARVVFLWCMGAPLFLSYLLYTLHSRVHPNWIAPAVLPLVCLMVIYGEVKWRAGERRVQAWLTAGLAIGLGMVAILHETDLVAKIAGQPLPPKLDPMTRVRGFKEMGEVVAQARSRLESEGRPVFIIGNHYGISSLMSFYLPEARARAKADPLVYCRSSDDANNQFYFWPGYQERRKGQNALYVCRLRMPPLASGWLPRWLAGETELLAHPPKSRALPGDLALEFESVTDLGIHKVLYRGRFFLPIQIFECRNLR